VSDLPLYMSLDGQRFTGWSEATVTRSLDSLADSFTVAYSGLPSAIGLGVGSACGLALGSHPLATGYVNQVDVHVEAESANTTCSGRSKAGDLADCAAVHKTGQWLRQSMLQIVTDLAAPFGIAVSADAQIAADSFRFERFEIDEGERVYDAMERLLRATGTIAVSQADGSIKLVRISRLAGLRAVQLPVQLAARRGLTHVDQDTYSVYRLRNQTMRANPTESPRHAALEKFEIADENVRRYRPFVLGSDTHARVEELRTQATWERNTRAGKALSITYTMPGGLAPDGRPWEPGMLVGVQDPQLAINETLLVVSASVKISNTDLDTELVLSLPEAYSLLPLPVRLLNKGVSLRG